jgi:hypothetical protein
MNDSHMNVINNHVVHSLDPFWCSNTPTTVIEKITNKCLSVTQPNSYVIGYLVWEAVDYSMWESHIKHFHRILSKHSRKFVLVLNTVFKTDNISHYPFDVVFLDYFLLRTYYEYKVNNHSYNKKWNNGNKFLFLTGKPYRENRIRLLYKLQQAGLLTDCKWSLFVTDDNTQRCRELLPELSDNEFSTFIDKFNRDIDVHLTDNHYGGHPYSVGLFSETSFRLISETAYGDSNLLSPWVTEKTWMTILNNQPFIMAGNVGTLNYLSKKGFRTFERYMKCPEYDLIEDGDSKLNTIVKNTEHFLHIADAESVADDVEHNHKHFMKLVDVNLDVIRKLLQTLDSEHHDPFDVIPLYDPS